MQNTSWCLFSQFRGLAGLGAASSCGQRAARPGVAKGSLPLALAPLGLPVWPGLPCRLRVPRGRAEASRRVAAGAGPGSLLPSALGQVRPRAGGELGSEGWWRVAGSRGAEAHGMGGIVAPLKHCLRQAGAGAQTLPAETRISLRLDPSGEGTPGVRAGSVLTLGPAAAALMELARAAWLAPPPGWRKRGWAGGLGSPRGHRGAVPGGGRLDATPATRPTGGCDLSTYSCLGPL